MALTPKISLNKFNWWSGEKISVTGFTWFEGEYLAGEAFAGLIKKNSDNFGNFKRVSALLNGQFAVVVESGSEVWLMCSHTWSYPLFYRTKQNTFLVSDDPEKLVVDRNGESPGTFTELYFYVFGVTPSFYTLNDHIFQVRPGEVVRLAKDKPETFLFLSSSEFKKNKKPGLSDPENLYQLFLGIFGRYYSRLKNRRILLPLTRGYDSRLHLGLSGVGELPRQCRPGRLLHLHAPDRRLRERLDLLGVLLERRARTLGERWGCRIQPRALGAGSTCSNHHTTNVEADHYDITAPVNCSAQENIDVLLAQRRPDGARGHRSRRSQRPRRGLGRRQLPGASGRRRSEREVV